MEKCGDCELRAVLEVVWNGHVEMIHVEVQTITGLNSTLGKEVDNLRNIIFPSSRIGSRNTSKID